MTDTDIEKRVSEALERLAGQHAPQPQQQEPERPYRVTKIWDPDAPRAPKRPRGRPFTSDDARRYTHDDRNTADVARRRENAPTSARSIEGQYADVKYPDGFATVIVLTVEQKAFGVKAYCKRLDNGQKDYHRLDDLTRIRDTE